MPVNGLNVGRDIALDVFTQSGVVRFNVTTGFDSKQMTTRHVVKGLDGVNRYLEIPEGWDGSITIEKADDVLDSYIAQLEANYYAGIGIQPSQITQTITNPDGSISVYRFTGVAFKLDDAGSWTGDKTVTQKLSWCASKRIKVQ
jgi:hypothetical protein